MGKQPDPPKMVFSNQISNQNQYLHLVDNNDAKRQLFQQYSGGQNFQINMNQPLPNNVN